jgi:hypothetical protein
MPDPYQVTVVLEPVRRLVVVAPTDGVIRSLEARLGGMVRGSQELAQLDRGESIAKLKVCHGRSQREAGRGQVQYSHQPIDRGYYSGNWRRPRREAELARSRSIAHRPGTVRGAGTDVPVTTGQYGQGSPIAELADITSLRAVLPVDRRSVSAGSALTVTVEEQDVAKVQAILPLPESLAMLRELATPFAAAVVDFSQSQGSPGGRSGGPRECHRGDRHCSQSRGTPG